MKRNILIIFGVILLLLSIACQQGDGKNTSVDAEKETNTNVNANDNNKEKESTESDEQNGVSKTGFPIVENEIELQMFANQSSGTGDNWNDIMLWNEYADKTNIKIKWEQVPESSLEEKRNLTLAAGGTLPDAFYAAKIPNLDLLKYGKQGEFIALNDLLDDYAPNLTKLMEEDPGIKQALTFPDGNIYSLPLINDPVYLSMRIGALPWIKSEWLEKVGMDNPTTTDEYYKFLTAVKAEAEKNGDTDITAFGAPNINYLLDWVKGSFGLSNRGNDLVDLDPNEEGSLRFIPASDEYKQMIEYVNKLYEEELIEQNIFSLEYQQFLTNGREGKYASTVWYLTEDSFGEDMGATYEHGLALEGPNGDRMFTQLTHPVANIGQFVITKDNEYPEATLRWIDHFYSDEGSQFFYMGIEGETFEETDEGEFVYTDTILDPVKSGELTFGQSITKHLVWPATGAAGIVKQVYFDGSESHPKSVAAAKELEPFLPEEAWPQFTTTEEESNFLSSVGADLEKYVVETRDKFIVGQIPLSEWDDYIKTLNQIGLEKYMSTYQDIYERYQAAE